MATLGGYIDGRETGQHDFMNWIEARDIMLVEDSVQWRAWAWCLASNLAQAGALCRAFKLGGGVELGPGRHIPLATGIAWIPDAHWRPGCGRAAP